MHDISEKDIFYFHHPELALPARIYRTNSESKQAIIIDMHGGAWTYGDHVYNALFHRNLATAGYTVMSIEFRHGPDYKHPSAIEDIEAAIEYARANADSFRGNPDRIGLSGDSSGGHLALLAGITTKQKIDYILACWPVSDPAYRYAYAQKVNRTRLVEAHEGYFENAENMQAASIQRILDAGEWRQLPPVLIVQSGEDLNVPVEMTAELVRAYQSAGGYLEYAFFPGEPHCFGNSPSPATERFNALVADFVRRHSE